MEPVLQIVHLDMDAFYASVEQREQPALKGQPVIVGGLGERGVVATASYEARAYGIHSAMPMAEARKRCPGGHFIQARHQLYRSVSRQVMMLLGEYAQRLEKLSLDEAFLDLSYAGQRQLAGGISAASEIKRRIKDEFDLTVSAGISYNKFLAKLASGLEKPDGFTVITHRRAQELLPDLPVGKLWGLGPQAEETMKNMGIETAGDLRQAPPEPLVKRLGSRVWDWIDMAHGRDDRPVGEPSRSHSISEETTFAEDVRGTAALAEVIDTFAGQLAAKLQERGWYFRTVSIKLRFASWQTISRSYTLPHHANQAEEIKRIAHWLLESEDFGYRPVRLVGLTVAGLNQGDAPQQQSIW